MTYVVYNIEHYPPSLVLLFEQDPTVEYGVAVARRLRNLGLKGPKSYMEFDCLKALSLEDWKDLVRQEWDVNQIIRHVANEQPSEFEDCEDGQRVKATFLGSLINPSRSFYLPFACSNVAGDCPVCQGKGGLPNETACQARYQKAQEERRIITSRFREVGLMFAEWPKKSQYRARVLDRCIARYAPATVCPICRGCGSKSAADDESWREAFEALLGEHDMSLEQGLNGDPCAYFVCQYVTVEPEEVENE